MQYGYGMAETHQQQFMEGDSCSSLFSISTSQKQNQHHHLHYQPYHHHLPPPQPPWPPQEQKHERQQQQQQQFFQLHSVPFTQQLLQQQHQFEAFQLQQQRRLHQQIRLENELGGAGGDGGGGGRRGGEGVGNGCGGGNGTSPSPSPLFFDFKLGLNENSGNREVVMNEEEGAEEEEGLIGGSEEHIPESWRSQEDGTIKEPFWKPLNAQLFNKNEEEGISNELDKETDNGETNKRINDGQVLDNDGGGGKNLGNKYRIFGELEAICGGAGLGETNQTGSGSALTGENLPRNAGFLRPLADPFHGDGAAAAVVVAIGVDHGSETSIGEEASLRKLQKRKRRRKLKDEMNSMAGFFESVVKQLVDHQEGLYRTFLEVVERIDQERIEREEAWKAQQLHNFNRESTARAHEQALASNREFAIVSYLEKITGQTIKLPDKNPTELHSHPHNKSPKINNSFSAGNRRWPKAEVKVLIQVRSSLEARFQEPGLKGSLWEEISSSMASMGYQRSSRRCKEKWENINKYFRKTKHSNKKRSHQSKTCPYFHQLDQLYSQYPNPSSSKGNSELLDAIVAINEPQKAEAGEEMNNHGDEKENDRADIKEGDNEEEEDDEEEEEEEDDEEGGGDDGDEEDGD